MRQPPPPRPTALQYLRALVDGLVAALAVKAFEMARPPHG
jgi:hypothetical protein